MPSNGRPGADFTQTRAIHAALKIALDKKHFAKQPELRRAAEGILKEIEADDSAYGRQLRMLNVMKKGASIEELGKKLGASRRTIFRYLNYLEQAGFNIRLEGSRYRLGSELADAG